MHEKVSVIVPIYKVEKYLRECIDSIINQTYTNLEIILVDDGSPDNCGAICDEYTLKDFRIRVIHKENGGLSHARNAGLDIATGDYYCFVDSDDMLPDHSVRTLLDLMKTHSGDMVIAGFERFSDESGEVFFSTEDEGLWTHVYSREEALKDFYRDGCQAWAVLYKRKIHEHIRFPKGEINEDEAIVFQILDLCDQVVVTSRVVYSYRNREESITTSSFSEKKLAWVKHCRDNLAFIQEKYPQLEEYALQRYRGSLLWALREMALSDESFPEAYRDIRSQLKSNRKSFIRTAFNSKSEILRFAFFEIVPFGLIRRILRYRHRN